MSRKFYGKFYGNWLIQPRILISVRFDPLTWQQKTAHSGRILAH